MSSPASSALAEVPAEQILQLAVSNLKAAPAYTMNCNYFPETGPGNATLRVLRGTGYESTLSGPGYGTLTMLEVDGTAWLKPDAEFIRAHAGRRGRRRKAILAGKYIRCDGAFPAAPAGIDDLTCLTAPGSVTKDPLETDDRQGIISLLSWSGRTVAYVTVTDTATPQFIEICLSRCYPVGSITVTYGTPTALTTPPADQTVDGPLTVIPDWEKGVRP